MHASALDLGKIFFSTYLKDSQERCIVDIGSQDVNGSLRSVAPASYKYIGVDFVAGKGVDVIITDPYALPFEDNSVDVIVCSSVFEHSEFFWELFTEILRIMKPDGVFYLSVPSNGNFHRYPVDCWRMYPDSGNALANWGRKKGFNVALLESFISNQDRSQWNDFVGVFVKDEKFVSAYPKRIQSVFSDFKNGLVYEKPGIFSNQSKKAEDQRGRPLKKIITAIKRALNRPGS